MADIDPSLVQQIFDIAKRKGKSHVHHHRKPDDLRAGSKIPKWAGVCHSGKLGDRPARIKIRRSDNTGAENSEAHDIGPLRLLAQITRKRARGA
jgi:hypothetical protein